MSLIGYVRQSHGQLCKKKETSNTSSKQSYIMLEWRIVQVFTLQWKRHLNLKQMEDSWWRKNCTQIAKIVMGKKSFQNSYLLVGRDLSCDSFSRPILSFKPNFRSGIPERKHFIRIFPVTSQRRTLPVMTKLLLNNKIDALQSSP